MKETRRREDAKREGAKEIERVAHRVIGAAIAVHRELGPGLLESVYEICMCHELRAQGLSFSRQREVELVYKGPVLPVGLRLDLVVEECLVVELKAIASSGGPRRAIANLPEGHGTPARPSVELQSGDDGDGNPTCRLEPPGVTPMRHGEPPGVPPWRHRAARHRAFALLHSRTADEETRPA